MQTRAFLEAVSSVGVFLLLAIPGYLFTKKKILQSRQVEGLSSVLVNFLWPAMVVDAMARVQADRELVRQAVALTAAEGGGIEIATDIEPQETLIYADKALMGQVAVNLLKNAREAVGGRPGGRIEIRARIDAAEHVVIEISNNGGAIPAEVTENIFTPFFSTKTDGSGIGLSVSRRIMQLHGGSLRLTANTDSRVTFTLRIG